MTRLVAPMIFLKILASFLSEENSPSQLTPGKYVQAILYLRGSRHRAEVGETKRHSKISCREKNKCLTGKYAPSPQRLGVALNIDIFDLHWRMSWKKTFCLSMAKKTLGNCSYSPLSGNGSHGRLSTSSRPMKNLQASRLLGRHPRRHLLA